jgi:hypothetical protein
MKFALLSYDTINLGDEIQSLAAQRFLPRTDLLVPRENLCAAPESDGPVALILNGWFLHAPERWPPHPRIDALPLSMHLSDWRPSRWRPWQAKPARRMLRGIGLDWFRRHAPIGARDRATQRILRERGIDAEFSGCLTLTLPPSSLPREEHIVACDLPPRLLRALRARVRMPVIETTHRDTRTRGPAQRMRLAAELLTRYARAHCVITTRLHCALPCLAFGTPVLFVPLAPDLDRQQPVFEFGHVATQAQFLARRTDFDPERPPPNPEVFRPYAHALARRCDAFVAARNDGRANGSA